MRAADWVQPKRRSCATNSRHNGCEAGPSAFNMKSERRVIDGARGAAYKPAVRGNLLWAIIGVGGPRKGMPVGPEMG